MSLLSKNVAITVMFSIILFQGLNNPNSLLNRHVLSRSGFFSPEFPFPPSVDLNSSVTSTSSRLSEHSKLFNKKEIIKVNEQVYVGIGYGLANIIVIEADSSFIIVDTLESVNGAKRFRDDFNALYNQNSSQCKPISAIVFTHYHADHTQGTTAFIDDPANPPIIVSHALTEEGLHRVNSIQSTIVYTRAARQFGTYIKAFDDRHSHDHADAAHVHVHNHHHPHEHEQPSLGNQSDGSKLHINSGIGPELLLGDAWDKSFVLPTRVLDAPHTEMTIDGTVLDIYHAPGETDDQIFIFLPATGTLLPADNIYETFPNLYAIRGSPTRDARKWVSSLDMMRYLPRSHPKGTINYMVPSHTRPVHGSDAIFELLTAYRDGIQYVHDQTMRWMNKGLTPGEMVPVIKCNLPRRLREHGWLQEFYGTLDWSIRGIFNSYLGWFSGDAADLFPLAKAKVAQGMVEILVAAHTKNGVKSGLQGLEGLDAMGGKVGAFGGNGASGGKDGFDAAQAIDLMLWDAEMRVETGGRDACQWGLDVASNVMHLVDDVALGWDGVHVQLSQEQYERARKARVSALTCMAGLQTSANGRNYYLTSALEDSGGFRIKPTKKAVGEVVEVLGLDVLLDAMTVRYRYEKSVKLGFANSTVCFVFDISDDGVELGVDGKGRSGEVFVWYMIELRDGVMEIMKGGDRVTKEDTRFGWVLDRQECVEKGSLVMQMKSDVYRELLANMKRSPPMLYALGEINVVKGSALKFKEFSGLFEKDLMDEEDQ